MATGHRTAYKLSQSQVSTPKEIVRLFWELTKAHRRRLDCVLDMGAGDCRFGFGGNFRRYVGVEIDSARVAEARVPPNGKVIRGCVFRHKEAGYDACVGNPPYARHHDLGNDWKSRIVARVKRELNITLNMHCNLYIYFFCLALLKSRPEGLVALVIPYEWVSRPSAKALREYIKQRRWNVSVYRFQMPIFEGVMTTASVSIVDKSRREGRWSFQDVTREYEIVKRAGIADSRRGVLEYSGRGAIWGLRGLSPGSQKIFTLTEGERIRSGLGLRDVSPCATSLKNVPGELRVLSKSTFRKHFVEAGEKCWLIRSDRAHLSDELKAYLSSISPAKRSTYTCRNQTPWFNYRIHPVPQVLFSSGFTSFGPKVLINAVGARAIGSVWGIHAKRSLPRRRLQHYLLGLNFERRVVAHAEKLKKVEVRQLNSVLKRFVVWERRHGRTRN